MKILHIHIFETIRELPYGFKEVRCKKCHEEFVKRPYKRKIRLTRELKCMNDFLLNSNSFSDLCKLSNDLKEISERNE